MVEEELIVKSQLELFELRMMSGGVEAARGPELGPLSRESGSKLGRWGTDILQVNPLLVSR